MLLPACQPLLQQEFHFQFRACGSYKLKSMPLAHPDHSAVSRLNSQPDARIAARPGNADQQGHHCGTQPAVLIALMYDQSQLGTDSGLDINEGCMADHDPASLSDNAESVLQNVAHQSFAAFRVQRRQAVGAFFGLELIIHAQNCIRVFVRSGPYLERLPSAAAHNQLIVFRSAAQCAKKRLSGRPLPLLLFCPSDAHDDFAPGFLMNNIARPARLSLVI